MDILIDIMVIALAIMNGGFMIVSYKAGNHKAALFSAFAFGWICSFMLLGLIK